MAFHGSTRYHNEPLAEIQNFPATGECNMSYDTLWAPWRLSYVTSTDEPRQEGCFLCRFRDAPADDVPNLVVKRGETCSVVLNRYPYNNGHLLVAPYAHKASLTELTDTELLESQQLIRTMISTLSKAMSPDGFNVGLNLGRVAGAGLPGHLHWHIVPRWNGDTNFMPVLAGANVIPQSLDALYQLLRETGL